MESSVRPNLLYFMWRDYDRKSKVRKGWNSIAREMREKARKRRDFGFGCFRAFSSFAGKNYSAFRFIRYTCTSNGANQSLNLPFETFTVRGDSYINS